MKKLNWKKLTRFVAVRALFSAAVLLICEGLGVPTHLPLFMGITLLWVLFSDLPDAYEDK